MNIYFRAKEKAMARITKDPAERANEIIAVAEELFISKGFTATAVSDIVGKIGVAQGLFYYYFKSKEEVLDAIVERYADLLLQTTQDIAQDNAINAIVKIQRIFSAMFDLGKGKEKLVDYIHQQSYEEMHNKLAVKMTEKLIPIFAALFRQGMTEGLFTMKDPDVTAEILLPGLAESLNRMVRQYWGGPEFPEKMGLALSVVEQAVGALQGSLQI
jgi:AcrR family transcriptional regulator